MLNDIKNDDGKILFSAIELQCKKSKDGIIDENFAKKLKELRLLYDNPMMVNSCCRSPEHNAEQGGVKNSFHIYDTTNNLKTCAIDIKKPTPLLTTKLIKLALNLDFSVGIAKTFIHLDCRQFRESLPQTIFLY